MLSKSQTGEHYPPENVIILTITVAMVCAARHTKKENSSCEYNYLVIYLTNNRE